MVKLNSAIASSILAAVVTTTSADAVVVTVGSQTWDIENVKGAYIDLTLLLEEQPWFGDLDRAVEFAGAVAGQLGQVNIPGFNTQDFGPYFAASNNAKEVGAATWEFDINAVNSSSFFAFADEDRVYAVATEVTPVPVSGALGFGLGGLIGLAGLRRRNRREGRSHQKH